MKVSNPFINTLRQISFKSNYNNPGDFENYKEKPVDDEYTLGYDDILSTERRKRIRESAYSHIMPYYKYHSETRLSEYELKKKIESLSRKAQIKNSILNDTDLMNIKELPGIPSSYSGQSLVDKSYDLFPLKCAGFKKIISISEYDKDYEKEIKNEGLEYSYFNYPESASNVPVFPFSNRNEAVAELKENTVIYNLSEEYSEENLKKFDKQSKEFIRDLIFFTKELKEGHCYLHCIYGTEKTDQILFLVGAVCPALKEFQNITGKIDAETHKAIKNILEALTESDKKQLGLS